MPLGRSQQLTACQILKSQRQWQWVPCIGRSRFRLAHGRAGKATVEGCLARGRRSKAMTTRTEGVRRLHEELGYADKVSRRFHVHVSQHQDLDILGRCKALNRMLTENVCSPLRKNLSHQRLPDPLRQHCSWAARAPSVAYY